MYKMTIILTTLVVLIVVGCTEPITDYSCEKDLDCRDGYYCDNQDSFRCIPPEELSCTLDEHCPPEPWFCNQTTGFCVSHRPDGGSDGEADGGDEEADADAGIDGGDVVEDGDELQDGGDETIDGGDNETDSGDEDPCASINCDDNLACTGTETCDGNGLQRSR